MFLRQFRHEFSTILRPKRKKSFLWMALLLIFTSFLEMAGIGLILPFFSAILDPKWSETTPIFAALKTHFNLVSQQDIILFFCIVLVTFYVIRLLFLVFAFSAQAFLSMSVRKDLVEDLYFNYLTLNYESFIDKDPSNMTFLATNVTDNFSKVFVFQLLILVSESFVSVTLISLLFFINFKLMLFLTLISGLFIVIYYNSTKNFIAKIGTKRQLSNRKLYSVIKESINTLKEIKVHQAESYFASLFNHVVYDTYRSQAISDAIHSVPRLSMEFIFFVLMIVTVAGYIILGGTAADLMPILAVLAASIFRILPSASRIIVAISSLKEQRINLTLLYQEFLTFKTKQLPPSSYVPPQPLSFSTAIQLKQLTYHYPSSQTDVLCDLSLTIEKNKTVAIVGKSGSGKTTLVEVLLGLLQPKSGEIYVDETQIDVGSSRFKTLFGYVPQTVGLIDDSIEKNIAFAVPEDKIDHNRIAYVLKQAQLDEYIQGLPEGTKSHVGDKGIKLSGGQRQRLGIARALYFDPDILIFDEATSALDAETERSVTDAIHRVGKIKTVIIIAHRLSTIIQCDKIFILDQGKIAAEGTYESLVTKNEWFKDIVTLNQLP